MFDSLLTVTFDEVFHVGTLDIADRQDWSYESDGLSVSGHPDEWAQIAKLPGATWVLRRTDGEPFTFASWHDLTETDRERLRTWAADQGWVAQRTVHRVSWFDSDYDEQVSMDFDFPAEAEQESEFRRDEDLSPTDLLLAVYAREHRPEIDGVWWDDHFDPDNLSCPRGVLVRTLDSYITTRR